MRAGGAPIVLDDAGEFRFNGLSTAPAYACRAASAIHAPVSA